MQPRKHHSTPRRGSHHAKTRRRNMREPYTWQGSAFTDKKFGKRGNAPKVKGKKRGTA